MLMMLVGVCHASVVEDMFRVADAPDAGWDLPWRRVCSKVQVG